MALEDSDVGVEMNDSSPKDGDMEAASALPKAGAE